MESGDERPVAAEPAAPADPARGTWLAVAYALAAVVLAGTWSVAMERGTSLTPFVFTALIAAAFLAERIAVPLSPRGWYTPSTPIVVLTGLVGGPLAGAVAGGVTALGDAEGAWRRRLAFGGLDAVRGFAAGLVGLLPLAGGTGAVLRSGLAVACAFALNAAGLRLIHAVRSVGQRRVFRRNLLADGLEAVVAVPGLALLLQSYESSGSTLMLLTLGSLLVALWLGAEAYRRSRAELAAEHLLARTDPLTGAPNRRALDEELHRSLARVRRGERPAGLLVFDVDRFKHVNSEIGWDGGDAVLRSVVERVADALRQTDLLARRGGEEFAVVAPGVDSIEALRALAEKVREHVRGLPFDVEGRRVSVTVSVGGALADGSDDRETVERRANLALAEAKNTRDRVVVWDSPPRPPVVTALSARLSSQS
ncbi:MAG TPA: GGDEF domain-containing protein [Gaiellaceae bacterium]|nr:GGDEF domain-containing protein [Gaiellaceae bacterium]